MKPYLWDLNSTRYHLIHSNPGIVVFNWLFLPGGPGADSCYFADMIKLINVPGNFWLVDFPGNGSNLNSEVDDDSFDIWSDCLLTCLKMFPNPILVGHSFGGMFPLLFPQLENILTGFVILSSAPSLWLEEVAKVAVAKKLPELTEPMLAFENRPSPTTFKQAMLACTPYYFAPESLEQGRALIEGLPFNYKAAVWWLKKAQAMNFSAKWVPQKLPTLILGGTEDAMTPVSLFEKDPRFKRPNITRKTIENAGHFLWVERPEEVKKAFEEYIHSL